MLNRHEEKEKLQKEAVKAFWANNTMGTYALATGCGKSKAAIDTIKEVESKYPEYYGLIVAPTEEMRDVDWPLEYAKWGFTPNAKHICFASLSKENLSKYDYICYDEVHRLTVPNLLKLQEWKATKINPIALGLTATYPKVKVAEDAERIYLIRELLPPVLIVKTDEAVERGLIADFEIKVVKFFIDTINKTVSGGTLTKPFLNTESKQYGYLTCNVQRMMYATKSEVAKFAAISKRVQFIYNLPSKLRLATKILVDLLNNPISRVLVFTGSIERANDLCGKNVFHSASDDLALQRFQRNETRLLGAVKSLNEGKNLESPEIALIKQVDSQERNLVQRIGRLVRIRDNNPTFKAQIIILVAAATVDEKWCDSAMADLDTKRITTVFERVPDLKEYERHKEQLGILIN